MSNKQIILIIGFIFVFGFLSGRFTKRDSVVLGNGMPSEVTIAYPVSKDATKFRDKVTLRAYQMWKDGESTDISRPTSNQQWAFTTPGGTTYLYAPVAD